MANSFSILSTTTGLGWLLGLLVVTRAVKTMFPGGRI
jgi:hypothetical protein